MDFPRTVVLAGERPAGVSLSGWPRLHAPRRGGAAPDILAAPGARAGHHASGAADVHGADGIGIDFGTVPGGNVERIGPGDAAASSVSDAAGADIGLLDAPVIDAVPTGFARLDAELPGGGWPRGVVTELLLPPAGAGELRLLAPALRAELRAGRTVMLFDPPPGLTARSLARLGLDAEHLLIVEGRSRALPDAGSLWALEQALKSGNVGAVVAWLPPRLAAERLRRLQSAAQRHGGPAFALREATAAALPTAAPLRLALHPAGDDALTLRLLKRRLPASARPSAGLLRLALPVLAALPPKVPWPTRNALPPRTVEAVDAGAGSETETETEATDEAADAANAAGMPSQGSLFASGRAMASAEPSSAAGAMSPPRRSVERTPSPDRVLHAAVFVDLAA